MLKKKQINGKNFLTNKKKDYTNYLENFIQIHRIKEKDVYSIGLSSIVDDNS